MTIGLSANSLDDPLAKIFPSLNTYDLFVIKRVSLTLWSVIRIPTPSLLYLRISFFKSLTARGSIPANGSSNNKYLGPFLPTVRALAISHLLLSPPES